MSSDLLYVVSVDAFLISDGSSFQSRVAATLDARSPNFLSLVRVTTRSPLSRTRSRSISQSFFSVCLFPTRTH